MAWYQGMVSDVDKKIRLGKLFKAILVGHGHNNLSQIRL